MARSFAAPGPLEPAPARIASACKRSAESVSSRPAPPRPARRRRSPPAWAARAPAPGPPPGPARRRRAQLAVVEGHGMPPSRWPRPRVARWQPLQARQSGLARVTRLHRGQPHPQPDVAGVEVEESSPEARGPLLLPGERAVLGLHRHPLRLGEDPRGLEGEAGGVARLGGEAGPVERVGQLVAGEHELGGQRRDLAQSAAAPMLSLASRRSSALRQARAATGSAGAQREAATGGTAPDRELVVDQSAAFPPRVSATRHPRARASARYPWRRARTFRMRSPARRRTKSSGVGQRSCAEGASARTSALRQFSGSSGERRVRSGGVLRARTASGPSGVSEKGSSPVSIS
jgi:hypothetical protein